MIDVDHGVSNIHRLVQLIIRLGLQDLNKEQILGEALELINNNYIREEYHTHVTSIWEYASKCNKVIDGYYFKSIYGKEGFNPLHLLVKNNRHKTIRHILTHLEKHSLNKIMNTRTRYGMTPLQLAAQSGNLELVKYLVEEKHAYINANNKWKRTPLYWAAEKGNFDLVKYLVGEKGADVNAIDHKTTPLHHAAQRGNLELVKYMVEEKGADVNAICNNKRTLLYYAAKRGNLDVVKYLEGKGFN